MKYTAGVKRVAKIIFARGDDGSLEECLQLVEETRQEGISIMEDGDSGYDSLQDLLQENLGLEPDYIEDLWL